MFSRTEKLIGGKAMDKLISCKVAVFGIGGVGSFAAEALARSQILNITLVDNDIICKSNINRQIHATTQTIGKNKVEIMKDRILLINPKANVTAIKMFYIADKNDDIIWDFDYIIDAIDTVSAKIDLILKAKKEHIPIISSMGAGNKLDPTKFQVTDIYNTTICPLAKVMRKELRKREVDALKVVYSTEEPVKLPLDTSVNNNHTRKISPASISFVPSVAGLIIAGEVIKAICFEEDIAKK